MDAGLFAMDPFWTWLCLGALLVLLELVTPGFVIMFFGLSAATVAIICAAAGDAFGLQLQLGAFAVLSVAYVLALRRFVKNIFTGDVAAPERSAAAPQADCAGRAVTVLERVRPGVPGRVQLGDAAWEAVSDDGSELLPGDDAIVTSRENLTLKVRRLA